MGREKTIGLIVVVLIALYILSGSGASLLSGITATSGLQQASAITGATITSISNVQVISNYANLTGPLVLTGVTINGAGQGLNSTQAALAKGINASYSTRTNNPVTVRFNLAQEGVNYNYQNSGTGLYYWTLNPIGFFYGYNCGFGVNCAQTSILNNYTISAIQLGSLPTSTIVAAIQGFQQKCAQNNGVTILTDALTSNPGILSAQATKVSCVSPVSNLIGDVWTSSTKNFYLNASITYSNGTTTGTINLSGLKPTGYYKNLLYAQIYGYTATTYSLNDQQAPSLFIFNNGTTRLVNPFSTASGLSASQGTSGLPQSWLQPALTLGGIAVQGIYEGPALVTQVKQANNQVNNYLYNVQLASAFSAMKIPAKAGLGSSIAGSVDLTSTPIYYPQVQLLSSIGTLSVYLPVAKPTFKSVSPNPITFTSGAVSTETFSVQNNANVSASAYISGSCGNSTFGPSANFNIGPGGTVPVSININSPYNPNLKQAGFTCSATVYSTSYGLFHDTISWQALVNPSCSAIGAVYVNTTTCKPQTPTLTNQSFNTSSAAGNSGAGIASGCRSGFTLNASSGVCVATGCGTGYYINASKSTATVTYCSPVPASGSTDYTLIAGIIVVVIAAVLVGRRLGHKGGGRRR